MGKYRVRFFVTERENPLGKERLDAIVNLLLDNPFGKYEKMCPDVDEHEFIPFSKNLLLEEIQRRKYFSIIMRSEMSSENPEGNLSITLTSEKNRNSLALIIDHDDFITSGEVGRFLLFVENMSKMFTKLTRGSVRAVEFNADKYRKKHKVKRLNDCFGGYIKWIHILGVFHYKENGYSKNDLLNAPAYKVEEWENDTVFMMSYKEPFSWDEEVTINQMKELNNYLLDKAEDIQW